MMSGFKSAGVPAEALLSPTLMLTGRSASGVYAQPAAELARLTRNGAAIKLARGFYAAVPVGKRADSWLPSLEATAAGIASAAYGVGKGAIWGLSAARVHGALPRALSVAYAMGPTQHGTVELIQRPGRVEFRCRDTQRLELEYFDTELGPGLVTSIAQTILDLSSSEFEEFGDPRSEAVRNLMAIVEPSELDELSQRVRGKSALGRAQRLVAHAQ